MTDFSKPGWVECRDGSIYYCYGVVPCSAERQPVLTQSNNGFLRNHSRDGFYAADRNACPRDLIHYLPDCTGFDWKPAPPEPKWRAFRTQEEAWVIAGKFVRNKSSGDRMDVFGIMVKGVQLGGVGFVRFSYFFEEFELCHEDFNTLTPCGVCE